MTLLTLVNLVTIRRDIRCCTVYYPERYPLLYGIYEGTGPDDPDYGRSIATLAGNLLFSQRDYLSPIPQEQMRLNPELKQNPGW